MRTIKFRGKTLNGAWVEGAYFVMQHNDERKHMHHFIIPDGTPIPKDKPIGDIQVEVQEATIGQFTGATDKDGKEIYEGDILDLFIPKNCGGRPEHRLRKVIFNEKSCGFLIVDKHNHCICDAVTTSIELIYTVIGNIHDNPELLEGE